ncbi:InlB B-repeat-containing protein [Treponema berlinense]|uniref:InlB B-repeat-containing protein n=1 Tax=Treponema berlinense TaxID=225004 RepID=UPI0023F7D359|nr:InlB B-repeat-containing protein [Treponema berlinense]
MQAVIRILGGGDDYPEITKTTISGIPESAVSEPVELTADVDGNNLEGAGIEYSWEVAEGRDYASFENPKAKKSKLVPNCAAEEKEVKIKVTATLKGTENGKSSEVYTVKIAAKQESSGEGSGSTEGGSTGGNTESGSTAETGSVSAVVNADGSISCGKCGKIYNFTEQVKNCEHYKCATCGSVYYSQSEVDSCTSHVTVIFKDSGENGNESVTMVIKSGSTVIPPSWEKENFALTWIDENGKETDFDDLISLSEGETEKTVTFTAKWETTYTVTFKDESGTNADVTVDVISGEVVGSVPEWTREHFTFAGWTSSVSGLTTDSVITGDVTFTANWTELPKCTNCGTHYATEDAANNCGKQEGCPKYGALTTITFSGTKTASASSDNDAIAVSITGNIKSGATIVYNDVTYNPVVKMESLTVITISGAAGKTIKVVCDAAKAIKYNASTKVSAVADGTAYVATFTAPDGDSFTINKGDTLNIGVIFIE